MSTLRFIVLMFSITAVLVFTVHLRGANSRSFYRFRRAYAEQSRLKQRLWQKQLQLEKLISPSAVLRQLDSEER